MLLLRLLQNLTAIERHVLTRVAVHVMNHQGRIPYIPPNTHQAPVAQALAAPGVRLLNPTTAMPRRQAYKLTRLGLLAVRQFVHFVPMAMVIKQEKEFTRMRNRMCCTWEISEEDDTNDEK